MAKRTSARRPARQSRACVWCWPWAVFVSWWARDAGSPSAAKPERKKVRSSCSSLSGKAVRRGSRSLSSGLPGRGRRRRPPSGAHRPRPRVRCHRCRLRTCTKALRGCRIWPVGTARTWSWSAPAMCPLTSRPLGSSGGGRVGEGPGRGACGTWGRIRIEDLFDCAPTGDGLSSMILGLLASLP